MIITEGQRFKLHDVELEQLFDAEFEVQEAGNHRIVLRPIRMDQMPNRASRRRYEALVRKTKNDKKNRGEAA